MGSAAYRLVLMVQHSQVPVRTTTTPSVYGMREQVHISTRLGDIRVRSQGYRLVLMVQHSQVLVRTAPSVYGM